MLDPMVNWDFNNTNDPTSINSAVSPEKRLGRKPEVEVNCRFHLEAEIRKVLKNFVLFNFCRVYFVDF